MMRIVAALVIATLAASCAAPATASSPPSASAPPASASAGAQQQHEAGAVTVAASWIAGTSSARVALDTHSVDLDGFDLTVLARARLDGGPWVSPTLWDAPKGGHHRSGTLTFASLQPQAIDGAAVIELEVRDVGASHLLRWERTR